MENKKYLTLGDVEAGNLSDADTAVVSEQLKIVAKIVQNYSDHIKGLEGEAKSLLDTLYDLGLPEIEEYIANNPPSSGAIAFLIFESIARYKSSHGRKASDARHSKEGGSRDKVGTIRKLWSSGKYSNRGICAEEESLSEILCVRHNMSIRSMYAKQDEQEETGSGAAQHSQRTH